MPYLLISGWTFRSPFVEKLLPKPGTDYRGLAHRTISPCDQILLKAVASEFRWQADTSRGSMAGDDRQELGVEV
jgi:hypothetical protein